MARVLRSLNNSIYEAATDLNLAPEGWNRQKDGPSATAILQELVGVPLPTFAKKSKGKGHVVAALEAVLALDGVGTLVVAAASLPPGANTSGVSSWKSTAATDPKPAPSASHATQQGDDTQLASGSGSSANDPAGDESPPDATDTAPRLKPEMVCPSILEHNPTLCSEAEGAECKFDHPQNCTSVDCEPRRQPECPNWHLRCKFSEVLARRQATEARRQEEKEERRRQVAFAKEVTKTLESSKYGKVLKHLVNSTRGPKSAGSPLQEEGGKNGSPAPKPNKGAAPTKSKANPKGKASPPPSCQGHTQTPVLAHPKGAAPTKGKANPKGKASPPPSCQGHTQTPVLACMPCCRNNTCAQVAAPPPARKPTVDEVKSMVEEVTALVMARLNQGA